MICVRCRLDFKPPPGGEHYIICGSCADDLRASRDAQAEALKAEAANIEFQMNKEAYEDALAQEHYDRP